MISLNVVVYDESNVIDRCLQSAKPYVDEVVLLIDRTCRFTDRLIEYADKFVIADLQGSIVEHHRNRLIESSSGDWILTLDPDEYIDPRLGGDIKVLIERDVEGYYLPRYNIVYDDNYKLSVGADYPDWNLRLVRNHARYSGVIYEDQLSLSTVKDALGLVKTLKYNEGGLMLHDKTYESVEEVKRTRELYNKWTET